MKFISVLVIYLFTYGHLISQDRIMQNDWFLYKMIYNGVEYSIPNDPEINEIILRAEEDEDTENLYYINTWSVCDSGAGGMMSYLTNDSFSFFDISGTFPSNCINSENQDFADMYLEFFIFNFEYDFPYLITEDENGDKTLIITNRVGNQTFYSNQLMSIQESEKSNFTIYPNPVKEKLSIENPDLKITSVKIRNASGKLVLMEDISAKQTEINFSSLPAGVYFISFEQNGKMLKTEKVIKR